MRSPAVQYIAAGFAIAGAILLIINMLTDRSTIWAIWPIWALGIVAAGLVGIVCYPGTRLFAVWAGAGAVVIAGLAVIDIAQGSDDWWFFWPLGVWLVLGMLFAGLTVDLLGSVPTSRPATDDELLPLQDPEESGTRATLTARTHESPTERPNGYNLP